MKHIDQTAHSFQYCIGHLFFIAFAENHGTGMTPNHPYNHLGFLERINRGQFCLDKNSQLITGLIKRFGGTPCVATDKVEAGTAQNSEIMQVLLFVKMRMAGRSEITMLGCSPEISGQAVDQNARFTAENRTRTVFPRYNIRNRIAIPQFK